MSLGGDDVDTGDGVVDGLAGQHLHGVVVQDVAGLVEQAVLAVAGVGVQRHVGHDAQLGEFFFQRPHHARNQAVGVERFFAIGRLQRGLNRRKQRQHRNAQTHAFFGHWQQQIQTQAIDTGHRRHGLAQVLALVDKHRVDQVVGRNCVLAHQIAGESVAAQAARTVARKRGGA